MNRKIMMKIGADARSEKKKYEENVDIFALHGE